VIADASDGALSADHGTHTSLIALISLRNKTIGMLVSLFIVVDGPGVKMQVCPLGNLDALVLEVFLGNVRMSKSHGRSPLEGIDLSA
jgi:hypothetical protein